MLISQTGISRSDGDLEMQFSLSLKGSEFNDGGLHHRTAASSPKGQLLKWIGNKQRFAECIISFFPRRYRTYFEPFLGSGAVLATLAPQAAEGSDIFQPLMGIWSSLKQRPEELKRWYSDRFLLF